VNAVANGLVKTDLWAGIPDGEAFYASIGNRLPVGHVAEAAEVAQTYLYLMRQTYSTGQVVTVDGGGGLV